MDGVIVLCVLALLVGVLAVTARPGTTRPRAGGGGGDTSTAFLTGGDLGGGGLAGDAGGDSGGGDCGGGDGGGAC